MSGSTNGGVTRAYEALRESEELHWATLSNISDAVFLTDDNGVFTYICRNVDVLFGYVPDEVQAMRRISHLLGENLFDPAELAARGEIQNIEREITTKLREQADCARSYQGRIDQGRHRPLFVPRRDRAQPRGG